MMEPNCLYEERLFIDSGTETRDHNAVSIDQSPSYRVEEGLRSIPLHTLLILISDMRGMAIEKL